MRSYKQLSQLQRYQIEILNKAGENQKEIAELLGVSPATTSAPGFFAKAEMGSIRFQRRKIFLAVIAFGGPRSSCSGRGAQ
ncbi:MAG: helix-turn-helix domain-containing protein, partial [Methylococcaceae bacterium]